MSKLFFLVRWWPHFSTNFPFEEFAEVLDADMALALEAYAQKYAQNNSESVMKARQARMNRRRSMDQGQPFMSFDAGRPRPRYDVRSLEDQPATWRELSEECGWVQRQRLLVGDEGTRGHRPTPWKVYYSMSDQPGSSTVLQVVQKHQQPPHGVYTWRVEHQATLSPVEHVSLQKAIDELTASMRGQNAPPLDNKATARRYVEYAVAPKSNTGDWLCDLYREAQTAEEIIARGRSEPSDQPTSGSPLKGSLASKPKGRRGRTQQGDPKQDQRIYDAWKSGAHSTFRDLARTLGVSEQEARLAHDRVRNRKNRASLRSRRSRPGQGPGRTED